MRSSAVDEHQLDAIVSLLGDIKMNKFTQHIPNFVDGATPEIFEFETTEQLLNSEVVKRYKGDDFSNFAMSDSHLMVISDNGFNWWVVGRIQDPSRVDLPLWDGGKYRAKLESGEEVVLSNEVVSSCGDVLTLRDGTKAKNLRD